MLRDTMQSWEEYWNNPARYLLVEECGVLGAMAHLQIYDFRNHDYHYIESDSLSAEITRRMREAGVRVVSRTAFDAFRAPIDDFLFRAVQSHCTHAEIEEYLASIKNPFL